MYKSAAGFCKAVCRGCLVPGILAEKENGTYEEDERETRIVDSKEKCGKIFDLSPRKECV